MPPVLTFIVLIEHPYCSLASVLRPCIDQTNIDCEILCLCSDDIFEKARHVIDTSSVPIRKLSVEGLSLAQQKNTALKEAQGEILVFLENGNYPCPECCKSILHLFSNRQAILIYTSIELAGKDPYGRIIVSERKTNGPMLPNTLPFRSIFPGYTFFHRSAISTGIKFKDNLYNPSRIFFNTIYLAYPNQAFYCSLPLIQQPIPQIEILTSNEGASYLSLIESIDQCPSLYSASDIDNSLCLKNIIQSTYNKPLIVFVPNVVKNSHDNLNENAHKLINFCNQFYGPSFTLIPVTDPSQERNTILDSTLCCYFYAHNIHDVMTKINSLGDRIILIAEDDKLLLMFSKPNPQIISRILFTNQTFSMNLCDNIDLVIKSNKLTSRDTFINSCLSTSLEELLSNAAAQNSFLQFIKSKEQERDSRVKGLQKHLSIARQLCADRVRINNLSLSIVICCRNVEITRLRRCLKSLRQQNTAAKVEIILSDYGSNEQKQLELSSAAQEFTALHIHTPTENIWSRSIALNIGIQAAYSDWVLTTDADMIFNADFITMVNNYISIFGDNCVFYAQPLKLLPVKLPEEWDNSLYQHFADKSWLFDQQGKGGCQVARRDILMKIRGFNEIYSIWGLEDFDIFERLGWAGLNRVWMEPGWYIHQWHLSNISRTSAKTENETAYFDLMAHPKVIVNSIFWGKESPAACVKPKHNDQSFDSVGFSKDTFEALLLNNEGNPEAQFRILMDIVHQLIDLDQHGAALQTLEDVCQLAPNNADAFALRSMITMLLKDYGRARLQVDRALELDPRHPQAVEVNKALIERYQC